MRVLPISLVLVLLAAAGRASAQPAPNAVALGRLAVACLADAPVPPAVVLDAPVPYLRSALTTAWTAAGRRVLADTARTAPRAEVRVEAASVAYARAGRGRLARTVRLGLRTRLVAPDGTVAYDVPCVETLRDEIAARDRATLEDPAFPETRGSGPPPSRLRRTGEAVLLGGAVVVGTLLLFSLRSR